MSSQMVWPFVFVMLTLFMVLANPLTSAGDRIGPGWADILNGGVAFLFLILAGVSAMVVRRRARRVQRQ
jgi:uncharacterized membrane protein